MDDRARPTPGEISAAIQIWQTSEPCSEGQNEAAMRMADLLRRFLPPLTYSDPAMARLLQRQIGYLQADLDRLACQGGQE